MKVSNKQKVGTYFKKENVFLATVSKSKSKTNTEEILKSEVGSEVPEELIKLAVDNFTSLEQFTDIFYKDDTGYIRFVEEGPEVFVGDNSDGKGTIQNVVSIWDYYTEEQIFECMVNNEFMAICALDVKPINKYNNDYRKG